MISAGDHSEHVLNKALLLLAPAITIVVASEFIVVGLLPLVSQDLRLPLAKAAELAGWWAFSAAVAGPFVTLLANRMAPRVTLIATLLLFALGNAVVALTADFNTMLVARVLQGAVLPAFVSVGASVVTRLAPPSEQGKKLARANIGFVLGVILALPASVALAQVGNWRLPFILLSVASLPMAMLVALFFPRLAEDRKIAIGGQLGLLQQPISSRISASPFCSSRQCLLPIPISVHGWNSRLASPLGTLRLCFSCMVRPALPATLSQDGLRMVRQSAQPLLPW